MYELNILFPVYNEERRLENGIIRTINFLDTFYKDKYVLTIVDNASIDKTKKIAETLTKQYNQVKYIFVNKKGVGAAFRAGIENNKSNIVGYMDVDLSTDIKHLTMVIDKFNEDDSLQFINASKLNKEAKMIGRKWYRNITSYGLSFLLKITLGMKATDSICGFKFFRKETIEKLINEAGESEDGWFYIIELLIRAERGNIKIYELPVRWKDDYDSKVDVINLIKNYLSNIIKLRKKLNKEGKRY